MPDTLSLIRRAAELQASADHGIGFTLKERNEFVRLVDSLDFGRLTVAAPLDAQRLKAAMLNVGPVGGVHRIDFQQAFAVTDRSQQQLAMEFAEAVATEYARLAAEPPADE
jgi:hypothetical protein